MKRLAHRLSDEGGQSLVLALLVLMVLAISLGSVIFFTAGNQRSSGYQKATQVATSLAEAGVNNAVSVLAKPGNANSLTLSWAVNGTSLLPDNSVAHPAYSTSTYAGGTVKWWGTFCDSVNTTPTACGTPAGSIPDWTWTLHSQATVTNPAHGSPIVKTMCAQVPLHPCVTSSVVGPGTTTPPVFDNNKVFGPDEGMLGGSVAGAFNLTPDGASYTCKTGQGELSWNATTRTLTVNGTIFIDGSVYAKSSSSAPITYTGWGSCTTTVPCDGVVYVTGTVYITSVELCAVVNAANTDCNWTAGAWNPNKKILVFLAHYQGTQTGVAAGQGIVVGPTQTSFQGGLYADYQVNTGQGAATQGPLVSGTQTVVTGQQFQGAFPDINILPISIQGPPQNFYIDPPRNFTYGG